MPFILTLIIGGATGVLLTHLLKLNWNIYLSMALGVMGAVLGAVLIRTAVNLSAGLSGAVAIFVSGIIGCAVLIWLIRLFLNRK